MFNDFFVKKTMDLISLMQQFSSNTYCIQQLEKIRWAEGPVCHYCKSTRSSAMPSENRHKCLACNRSYSVLQGTIFEGTKITLSKWFMAIYLIADAKKGISSLQLSRHINVNKDTAWSMQRRIRKAMEEDYYLQGIVELDETYVGGSRSNKKKGEIEKKQIPKAGMTHKTPVLGMYEREGKILLKVLNKAWGEEIKPYVKQCIHPNSKIISDGFGGYFGLRTHFRDHIVLNHEKKQYAKRGYSMSTIEGFWAMLKRAVIGVYHKISFRYLQEYLNEISFKFNYRSTSNRFEILLSRMLEPFPNIG